MIVNQYQSKTPACTRQAGELICWGLSSVVRSISHHKAALFFPSRVLYYLELIGFGNQNLSRFMMLVAYSFLCISQTSLLFSRNFLCLLLPYMWQAIGSHCCYQAVLWVLMFWPMLLPLHHIFFDFCGNCSRRKRLDRIRLRKEVCWSRNLIFWD